MVARSGQVTHQVQAWVSLKTRGHGHGLRIDLIMMPGMSLVEVNLMKPDLIDTITKRGGTKRAV